MGRGQAFKMGEKGGGRSSILRLGKMGIGKKTCIRLSGKFCLSFHFTDRMF